MNTLFDYFKGFLEIVNTETPRYNFVIDKLEIIYQNSLKTKIQYFPVGCYRPLNQFIADMNHDNVCRKFKPIHAHMIIGIHVLEKTLNFNNQEQADLYINFVKSCMQQIQESQ